LTKRRCAADTQIGLEVSLPVHLRQPTITLQRITEDIFVPILRTPRTVECGFFYSFLFLTYLHMHGMSSRPAFSRPMPRPLSKYVSKYVSK